MITIVIPIYNRASVLGRTLESIAASTYRPISLILVDNGSMDGSMDVAQDFQRKYMSDDFNIYFTEEKQKGASFARNKGLSRVKSKFVYFFDDDDLFDKDFLTVFEGLLSELINDHTTPDMVCLTTNMQVGNRKPCVRDYHFHGTDPVCNQIIAGPLNTASMIFRTEFLRDIGGWNENVTTWDDWELGVRALLHKPLLYWYKDRAFHMTFVHDDSQTGPSIKSRRPAIMKAIEEVEKQLTDPLQKKALKLRKFNVSFHIPGLWRIAKYFKKKEKKER